MKLLHGYDVQDGQDPFVDLAERAMDQLSQLTVPGAFLVDAFPIFRYIPEWFPGGGYKRLIAPFRKTATDTMEIPYEFVKSRLVWLLFYHIAQLTRFAPPEGPYECSQLHIRPFGE